MSKLQLLCTCTLLVLHLTKLYIVSGMSYLNGMQDKLKDLVFHLHLKTGKTVKEAPLDLKEAKKDL